jgi:hypothetical protein
MNIKLRTEKEEILLMSWDFGKAEPNKNIAGPTVRKVLPHWDSDYFEVVLEVEGQDELSSTYKLKYKAKKQIEKSNSTRIMNQ